MASISGSSNVNSISAGKSNWHHSDFLKKKLSRIFQLQNYAWCDWFASSAGRTTARLLMLSNNIYGFLQRHFRSISIRIYSALRSVLCAAILCWHFTAAAAIATNPSLPSYIFFAVKTTTDASWRSVSVDVHICEHLAKKNLRGWRQLSKPWLGMLWRSAFFWNEIFELPSNIHS